ncbi:MAG: 30S ribosomal protein S12 methylthiotransferase RimO [Clostridia bacterium]|nr:30S ribosomal protein S12 methylthiotransferase RimO [Clostridia bacterium]
MKERVGVVSLGCAKNLVDTEVMLGILSESGYRITPEASEAEVLIINTCGFISAAKEESINTILDLAQYKETGNCKALIVTGCLGQKYKDDLAGELPEVDAIIGTGQVAEIGQVVERVLKGRERVLEVSKPDFIYSHELPRIQSTPGYSAYVKIADGCDNCCSYCVIPELRGNYRSRPIESIVQEVKNLAALGVKEIMLIAQDTTRYGQDLYGEYKLVDLLERLKAIDGVVWLRLLYCYPSHFTQGLIDFMAVNPKVCKYLDIPLQHATDRILADMNRKGNRQQIVDLIGRIRSKMPDIVLRTSFIVGLPGESEEDFEELLGFMREMEFDHVGIFTYSQEEGTPAADFPQQVPEELKEDRYDRAMALQLSISQEKNQRRVGKRLEVLVEGEVTGEPGTFYGRSEGNAPEIDGKIYFTGTGFQPGDVVMVRITQGFDYDLMGEVANELS